MPTQPSLEAFYASTIQPSFEELDAERRALVARMVQMGLLLGGLALVLGLVAVRFFGFPALIFVVMGGFGIWLWQTGDQRARYRSLFKDRVIRAIVRFVGDDMRYDPDRTIAEGEYLASQIYLTDPDRYDGEDLISGTRGATAFRFSEIHSEYKTESTDSKGRRQTHWHTIFKGIFFIGDFNKHFQGLTVVLPDTAERALGFIGKALQSWSSKLDSRQGELVALEDPDFERAFVVYSTDQIEARYILSTSLMRRILEYKERTGRDIALSFHDSEIYVAIPSSKNHFEAPSVLTPIAQSMSLEQVRSYLEDLLLVVAIIDELDLNTRIWSKQPGAVPNT